MLARLYPDLVLRSRAKRGVSKDRARRARVYLEIGTIECASRLEPTCDVRDAPQSAFLYCAAGGRRSSPWGIVGIRGKSSVVAGVLRRRPAAARHGERRHIRGKFDAAPVRKDQVAREDMHLALTAALALDDVFGPDRDALGDTNCLHDHLPPPRKLLTNASGRSGFRHCHVIVTIRPQQSNMVGKPRRIEEL